jgi:hypothetical protein
MGQFIYRKIQDDISKIHNGTVAVFFMSIPYRSRSFFPAFFLKPISGVSYVGVNFSPGRLSHFIIIKNV